MEPQVPEFWFAAADRSGRGIYTASDMVIALFDGEATARDGKPYRNTYTWHMRMRDGKIFEAIAFFDDVEFNDSGKGQV